MWLEPQKSMQRQWPMPLEPQRSMQRGEPVQLQRMIALRQRGLEHQHTMQTVLEGLEISQIVHWSRSSDRLERRSKRDGSAGPLPSTGGPGALEAGLTGSAATQANFFCKWPQGQPAQAAEDQCEAVPGARGSHCALC